MPGKRVRNVRVKKEWSSSNNDNMMIEDGVMEAILGSLQELGNVPKENAVVGALSELTPQPAQLTPYIEITEQPKQRDHRFRYPVEGRQAGSIAGEKSTSDRPTFPTITVHNLQCPAKVVASLVTRDATPRPHPHRLVGEHCKNGVCIMTIHPGEPTAVFRKIGVQRTMNKEVENTLKEREKAGVQLSMEVNKNKSGRKHNYDMKCVRLYIEVYLEDSAGKSTYLEPVVSGPIYDKKDTILQISRVNIKGGSVAGGDELFILCDKVQADDIRVKFTGTDPINNSKWDAFGIFGHNDVHRQFAIVCKTPPFARQDINAPVTVMFKLFRPSDEEYSNEMEYTYRPQEKDVGMIEKKRRKVSHSDFNKFFTTTSRGKPLKTETLGASSQTCSGKPVTAPVSSAPATLTLNSGASTSSSAVRDNLRRTLLDRGADASGKSSRPSTPSSIHFSGGTAQIQDTNFTVTTTYASEAHMSVGHMIQQQQQQPESDDTGQIEVLDCSNIPTQAYLHALATNQQPIMAASAQPEEQMMDEERQTSEQKINAIAFELQNSVNQFSNRVLVQPEPSGLLQDVAFSSLHTVDVAAIQEVSSDFTFSFPVSFNTGDESMMDVNETSNP